MPLRPTTVAHLDHVLATAQRDGRLPSVAAGLVRGGELVWSGAAGPPVHGPDGSRPDELSVTDESRCDRGQSVRALPRRKEVVEARGGGG